MVTATNKELAELILNLDSAIEQAVNDPLQFVDSPLLGRLRSSCESLVSFKEDKPVVDECPEAMLESEKRAALLWQVRSLAGRLQMLLDSAARFYSSCFSPAQAEELAYGVHGEWSALGNTSHLALDC